MRSLRAGLVGAVAVAVACGTAPPRVSPIMPAALVPVDAAHDRAKAFARVFCSTLPHFRDPAGHPWGDCGQYLDATDAPGPLGPLAPPYRFLFVAGFGSGCLNDVRAFGSGLAHLRDAHQVDIDAFAVAPFGSSEENGRSIARHLEQAWTADAARPFVLIGYDKGAADLIEALGALDEPATKVAALVTVAGAVDGSPVVEDIRRLMQPGQPWIAPGCPGNVQDGLHSLEPEVRMRILRAHPVPVPGYSLAAASTREETSSVLRPAWDRLSTLAAEQDGQLVAWETVLPGAAFLGTARADHWAVALPFDGTPAPIKGIDRSRFPRDALLEAIVRYVSADRPGSDRTRSTAVGRGPSGW